MSQGGTGATEWASLREAHQRAIGRFVDEVARLDEPGWLRPSAPAKWCPGQIAEHLVLTYDALLRELAGGVGMRLRARWWQRLLFRLRFLPTILKQGRLPPGAPAVREIRPGETPRPREAVVTDLRERAVRFDEELTRAQADGGGRLTHPFFGQLRPGEALRFVAIHAEHHRKQIPDAP